MNSVNEYQLNIDSESDPLESAKRTGLKSAITNNLRIALPLLIILLTALAVTFFFVMQPEAQPRRPNLTPPLTVSVHDVEAQEFQVNVQSYGTVAPRTQSFLIAQVSGLVTNISDNLREGSFFNQGDVLLQIDDRDYIADVKISEANLAEARQALSEELALSKQAEEDWKRLGNTEPPNDLVLRKPQQLAAQAKLASAEAALSKAQLGLDRAQVIAPFDGRVLRKMVDLGQVAGNNAQVAEVYATDYVEVRLPLRDTDLQFVDLPVAYRGVGEQPAQTPVNIFSSLSKSEVPWAGNVVRTESAIDSNSRQLHVVAQIDDPFGAAAVGRTPLKIGEYITAEIQGKVIPNAIVIPAESIYQDTYVYTVKDGVIVRTEIDLLWQNTSDALIGSGLNPGDRVVVTTLGQVASGTRVNIESEAAQGNQRSFGAGSQSANGRGNNSNFENGRPSGTGDNSNGARPAGFSGSRTPGNNNTERQNPSADAESPPNRG